VRVDALVSQAESTLKTILVPDAEGGDILRVVCGYRPDIVERHHRPMNASSSSMLSRVAASATIALAIAFGSVVSAGPAMAAAPSEVDPSTLTPGPPDYFNAECREAGQRVICDLSFVDPVRPVAEPTGIVCDSAAGQFEVLDTSIRSVQGKRYYSAEGLLERRHFSDRIEGVLTNSITGASVTYDQRTTYLHDLTTPGDVTTGAENRTAHLRVATSTGVVLIEAGRLVLSVEDESTLFRAGPHPIDDYFVEGDTSAVAPLCSALS
jgi:hypothetical protein